MSLIIALLLFQFKDETIARTCKSVEGAKIYSNAYYDEETGDVSGFELAVFPQKHSNALLFVYEGAPSGDPIPLKRSLNGHVTTWEGSMVETLTEYPSKREVKHLRRARLTGKMSDATVAGSIQVDEFESNKLLLKKVTNLWMCRSKK